MKKKFCPQCGREETEDNLLIDELCMRCSNIKLLEGYQDPKIRICANCGSYFFRNKLLPPVDTDFDENVKKIIKEMFEPKIKFYPDAEISDFRMNINLPKTFHHASGNNPIVDIEILITAIINSKKIKEHPIISLKIRFISCKRCNLQNSKYYEAVLQIRPYSEKVVNYIKYSVSQRKDVFITNEEKLKEGINFYITSKIYAMALLSSLKKKFDGETKITNELYSQRKDGKAIYRSTLLFRLSKPL